MSEPKTFRSTVSARGHNQLIPNTRGSAVDTTRAIGIVAASLLHKVKDVLARAAAAGYTDATLELVVPTGLSHGEDIRLCETFKDLLDRDPGLRASALGKRTQLKWVRSGPVQPVRAPAAPAEAPAKPVEAKRELVAPRAFDPLGDLLAQMHAEDSWAAIKTELAKRHDLKEPSITVPVPKGIDGDLVLDFIAALAVNDGDRLGYPKFCLHVTPTGA